MARCHSQKRPCIALMNSCKMAVLCRSRGMRVAQQKWDFYGEICRPQYKGVPCESKNFTKGMEWINEIGNTTKKTWQNN
jgi:hypothetical protein